MDIGEETDIYIPRIEWTKKDSVTLSIFRLNRRQNKLEILLGNVETGETKVILVEECSTGWIEIKDTLYFFTKESKFLLTSEKSGFRHIYLYDYEGNELLQLTSGEWEVYDVNGVDEETGLVYFAGNRENHMDSYIYRVSVKGGEIERIVSNGTWHTALFAPNFRTFIHHYSDLYTPTKISLNDCSGNEIRVLVPNDLSKVLSKYKIQFPEIGSFTTSDGEEIYYSIVKPKDFDPTKKYPVFFYGYGGPGSRFITREWGFGNYRNMQRILYFNYFCQSGFIGFAIDNRGTGGRGRAFKHLSYRDFSKYAVQDHIEAMKFLHSFSYIDRERVSFFGWSFGGYLACHLLLRATEYFQIGVSVAPVTDFRLYDTIWTERYMGLLKENEDGYTEADVLTYVNNLKGNLLVIHGTGDDNVHPQNTMILVNKLIEKGKDFDMMLYPNRNHGISSNGASIHIHKKIAK